MPVRLIRNGNAFISDASDGDGLQKAPNCAAANFMERVYIHAFLQIIRLNSSLGRETNNVLFSGGKFLGRATFCSVTIPITALCVTSLSGRSDLIFAEESLVGLSCRQSWTLKHLQSHVIRNNSSFGTFFWTLQTLRRKETIIKA